MNLLKLGLTNEEINNYGFWIRRNEARHQNLNRPSAHDVAAPRGFN